MIEDSTVSSAHCSARSGRWTMPPTGSLPRHRPDLSTSHCAGCRTVPTTLSSGLGRGGTGCVRRSQGPTCGCQRRRSNRGDIVSGQRRHQVAASSCQTRSRCLRRTRRAEACDHHSRRATQRQDSHSPLRSATTCLPWPFRCGCWPPRLPTHEFTLESTIPPMPWWAR